MAELGACLICDEKVFGSQPICFGCFTDLEVAQIEDESGIEYTAASYEYDGDEEE